MGFFGLFKAKSAVKSAAPQESQAKAQAETPHRAFVEYDRNSHGSQSSPPPSPVLKRPTNPRLYYSSSAANVPSFEEKLRADFQSLEERLGLIEKSMQSQKHDYESHAATLSNDMNDVRQIQKDFVTKADFDEIRSAIETSLSVDQDAAQSIQEKALTLYNDLAEVRLIVSQIESAWAKTEERLEGALRSLRDHHDLKQENYQREKDLQEQIFELAQCRLERDAGQINVRRSCAEWVIPNVRAKADLMPRGTCVTSPAFAIELAPLSPGCRPLRLEGLRIDFYPSGRTATQEGFCSLALRSESGLPWVRYWLAIGGFRRGPLDPLTEVVDEICPLVGAMVGESGKEAVRLSVEFIEPHQLNSHVGAEVASFQKARRTELSNLNGGLSNQKLPPFPGQAVAIPKVASLWSETNRGT